MYNTILLIDDDQDDTDLFVEALAEINPAITCYHAIDGRQALDKLLTKQIRRPDIIFLDINMPGMNGWQCLKSLKGQELLQQIPVIMYSTSSAQRDRDIATDLGALGFLTKPTDYRDLKKALRLLTGQNSLEALQSSIAQLHNN